MKSDKSLVKRFSLQRVVQNASSFLWKEVGELQSSQEEADTRIFLHADLVSQSGAYEAVVITADDTDVLVLALGLAKVIPLPMYQESGTSTRTRVTFTDISAMADSCGSGICEVIVSVHAFTGCGSTSAFVGRGKAGALKLLGKDPEYQELFAQLGNDWDISEDVYKMAEKFTCRMNDPRCISADVNKCLWNLFCTKRGETDLSQLPPCRDCLQQHMQRANCQSANGNDPFSKIQIFLVLWILHIIFMAGFCKTID